jgi:flagellar motor protein MotB
MNVLRKKARFPRLERPEPPSIKRSLATAGTAENDHLWVVSYADLLMVLLSFFVLFFSTGKLTDDKLIRKLLLKEPTVASKQVTEQANSVQTSPSVKPVHHLSGELLRSLSGLNLTTARQDDKIVVYFPDNVFREGSIRLPKSQVQSFKKLISEIAPYSQQLHFKIVGHTDHAWKVGEKRISRFRDNLELSTERARVALQFAVRNGIPQQALSVEGAADFQRDSRTLSIVIEERRVGSL